MLRSQPFPLHPQKQHIRSLTQHNVRELDASLRVPRFISVGLRVEALWFTPVYIGTTVNIQGLGSRVYNEAAMILGILHH